MLVEIQRDSHHCWASVDQGPKAIYGFPSFMWEARVTRAMLLRHTSSTCAYVGSTDCSCGGRRVRLACSPRTRGGGLEGASRQCRYDRRVCVLRRAGMLHPAYRSPGSVQHYMRSQKRCDLKLPCHWKFGRPPTRASGRAGTRRNVSYGLAVRNETKLMHAEKCWQHATDRRPGFFRRYSAAEQGFKIM